MVEMWSKPDPLRKAIPTHEDIQQSASARILKPATIQDILVFTMVFSSETDIEVKVTHEIQRSRELFASCTQQYHDFKKTNEAIKTVSTDFEQDVAQVYPSSGKLEKSLSVLNNHVESYRMESSIIKDDATLERAWKDIKVTLDILLTDMQ